MAAVARIKTDCASHTFEEIDDAIAISEKTGNTKRVKRLLGYKAKGQAVIHYCKGTDPGAEDDTEITTCVGCHDYRQMR
jgi:hypothetical protein